MSGPIICVGLYICTSKWKYKYTLQKLLPLKPTGWVEEDAWMVGRLFPHMETTSVQLSVHLFHPGLVWTCKERTKPKTLVCVCAVTSEITEVDTTVVPHMYVWRRDTNRRGGFLQHVMMYKIGAKYELKTKYKIMIIQLDHSKFKY